MAALASPGSPVISRLPSEQLRTVVESYELLGRADHGSALVTARMWPSAAGQIVLNAGDPIRTGDLSIGHGEAVVLGPTQVARLASFEGRVDVVTVNLRATGLAALIRPPIRELVGQIVTPRQIGLALDWHALLPLCADARITFLDRLLVEHVVHPVRPDLRAAVEWIVQRRGDVRSAELERHAGLSASQLQRLFSTHVGVTPKHYARIRRFLFARSLMREVARGRATLAGVAAAAGFADQAHLTREVTSLTQLTPARLVEIGHAVFLQD